MSACEANLAFACVWEGLPFPCVIFSDAGTYISGTVPASSSSPYFLLEGGVSYLVGS
jgi:hypothetical protein